MTEPEVPESKRKAVIQEVTPIKTSEPAMTVTHALRQNLHEVTGFSWKLDDR
nr:hypothetical protein Q903MT_gene4822 [Picea sitchensis]